MSALTITRLPMAEKRFPLNFTAHYSNEEFEKIQQGYSLKNIDEKWLIYYEEPWLYFYRSWTGICVFQLRFAQINDVWKVVESWVADGGSPYDKNTNEHDQKLVSKLINSKILQNPLNT